MESVYQAISVQKIDTPSFNMMFQIRIMMSPNVAWYKSIDTLSNNLFWSIPKILTKLSKTICNKTEGFLVQTNRNSNIDFMVDSQISYLF